MAMGCRHLAASAALVAALLSPAGCDAFVGPSLSFTPQHRATAPRASLPASSPPISVQRRSVLTPPPTRTRRHPSAAFGVTPRSPPPPPTVSADWRRSRRSTPLPAPSLSLSSSATADDGGSSSSSSSSSRLDVLKRRASAFCNLFPLWTVLTSLLALSRPSAFDFVDTRYFTAMIGTLMLCMGITLKPSDFKRVSQRPGAVLLAFVGCYGVMPALALTLGRALSLPPGLAAGLVLVSCINGAQASNLCTYIGQGDLALSVLMTTMTTVGAIVMTPLMGKLLLGQVVPVNAAAVSLSTVQVVLGPILLGMTINAKFPRFVEAVLPFSPIVGVVITCLLVGSAVAGCAGPILAAGPRLQLAAFLLHALGGIAGYVFTKPFYGEDVCRTFAIEFAMKSSAFGYLLACIHFSDPAVRVPSAVSIVWMTLIGSSLAVASRFFPPEECVVE